MSSHNHEQEMKVAQAKKAARALMKDELENFLQSNNQIEMACDEKPLLSIIIVTFNAAELTLACIRSLVAHNDISSELIIIDNGSTDKTVELLTHLTGPIIVLNRSNTGFVKAVNQGASIAKAKYILLLNSDVCIKENSIASALETIESRKSIGAVGAKLIFYGDLLQEAGSIIWNDGTCSGYGKWDSPDEGEYNFSRSVDYCSGAFLLLSKNVFVSLGKFDEGFSPGYYEETDFCVRLRNNGLEVVYDPKVEAYHFEFGSSDRKSGIDLQHRNQGLFVSKHLDYLTKLYPKNSKKLAARSKDLYGRKVLIIDDKVPVGPLDCGVNGCATIIKEIHSMGCFITLYPLDFQLEQWPLLRKVIPQDVEIMGRKGLKGLEQFLNDRDGYYDVCMVSGSHNLELFCEILARNPNLFGSTRLVYYDQSSTDIELPEKLLKRDLWNNICERSLDRIVFDYCSKHFRHQLQTILGL